MPSHALTVLASVRRDSWIDHSARFISLIGVSSPTFWLAFIMLALFYGLTAVCIAAALWTAGAGWLSFAGLAVFAAHLASQVARIDIDDPALCQHLFWSNRDAGFLLFAGLQ